MSVYGGDSWVPEVQRRRRRVEELLTDGVADYEGQFKRSSNGRFACLVCPSQPVLDTMPMLMLHRKGSGHQAAAAKRSRKEFQQGEQVQKRIALSLHDAPSANSPTSSPMVASNATRILRSSAPLLVETRKRTAHFLSGGVDGKDSLGVSSDALLNVSSGSHKVQKFVCKTRYNHLLPATASAASEVVPEKDRKESSSTDRATPISHSTFPLLAPMPQTTEKQQQELQVWQERELRFREAGWRRDALGGWFKEENVEFDSDEEAPKLSP